MLICPTERVVGAEEGLQRGSLQLNQTEVQDLLKWTAMSSKPRPHHLCKIREASVDCSEVSLMGNIQSLEHINQEQEQVSKIVRSPLQNHD